MKKFKDFIFEESQCRSPWNAIGRDSARPMSTNKLFNTLYKTHNDITKVTWPKSTTIHHDISKLSKKKIWIIISKCEIVGNGNKGKFIPKKENPKTNYGILAFELHGHFF